MRISVSFIYFICVFIGVLILSIFYSLIGVWIEQLKNLPRENLISYIFYLNGAQLLIEVFVESVFSILLYSLIPIIIGFAVTIIACTRVKLAKVVIIANLLLLLLSVVMVISLSNGINGYGIESAGFTIIGITAFWIAGVASLITLIATTASNSFPLKFIPVLAACAILMLSTSILLLSLPDSFKRSNEVKNKILELYADPEFPIYEPLYLPVGVGELKTESAYVNEDSSISYLRIYNYKFEIIGRFMIKQTKPKGHISAKDNLNSLINEIENVSPRRTINVDYKVLTANNQPALIYTIQRRSGEIDRMLYIFYDDMWIEASVPNQIGGISGDLSEEDLIKLAESFRRVD